MTGDDASLRRLALQIAMQLPEDRTEALRVIELTRDLTVGFIHRPGQRKLAIVPVAKIVPLTAATDAG